MGSALSIPIHYHNHMLPRKAAKVKGPVGGLNEDCDRMNKAVVNGLIRK